MDNAVKEDFIQFGQDENQNYVHIDDAMNGAKCGLVCPGCGGRLVARNGGSKIRHHYSHLASAPENLLRPCGETVLHLISKKIFQKIVLLKIPNPFQGIFYGFGSKISNVDLESDNYVDFRISGVMEEHRDKNTGLVFDCFANLENGDGCLLQIAVEMRVTHEIGEEKRTLIKNNDISCLQIDLRHLIGKRFGEAEILKAIFNPELVHLANDLKNSISKNFGICEMHRSTSPECAKNYQDFINKKLSGCSLQIPIYTQHFLNHEKEKLVKSSKKEKFTHAIVGLGCHRISFRFLGEIRFEVKLVSSHSKWVDIGDQDGPDVEVISNYLFDPFDIFDNYSQLNVKFFQNIRRTTEVRTVTASYELEQERYAEAHEYSRKACLGLADIKSRLTDSHASQIFRFLNNESSRCFSADLAFEVEKILFLNLFNTNIGEKDIARALSSTPAVIEAYEDIHSKINSFYGAAKSANDFVIKKAGPKFNNHEIAHWVNISRNMIGLDIEAWAHLISAKFSRAKHEIRSGQRSQLLDSRDIFCERQTVNDRNKLLDVIKFFVMSPLSGYLSFESKYRSSHAEVFDGYSSATPHQIVTVLLMDISNHGSSSMEAIELGLAEIAAFDRCFEKIKQFKDIDFDSKRLREIVLNAVNFLTSEYSLSCFVKKSFSHMQKYGWIKVEGDSVVRVEDYLQAYICSFKRS